MRHANVCYYASAPGNHMFPEYLSIVSVALRRADGEPGTLCDSWLAAGCDAHQTQRRLLTLSSAVFECMHPKKKCTHFVSKETNRANNNQVSALTLCTGGMNIRLHVQE